MQTCPLLCLVLLVGAAPRASAQTIPNPSFETNTFPNGVGYVSENTPITGWTANPTNRVGINPSTASGNTFADNGAVPQGTKVAFIQSDAGVPSTLSTTITGLVVSTTYRVQFRFNRRVGGGSAAPAPAYRINGGAATPFYAGLGVGGANPYNTVNALFTATATTAALEITNSTATDSALLVDNFLVTAASAIQVTNSNDSGAGSLRTALATAQGTPAANVITFAPALNGATIPLASQIIISDPNGVCIDASALSNGIKIDPVNDVRPFFNAVGSMCSLRKVTLENANITIHAGAILNEGFMQLFQCKFFGNVAAGVGGAVFNSSVISLTDCLFVGNTSSIAAAALLHQGTSATVTRCTFMNNHADSIGGAVYATAPNFSVTACTFTGNTSNDAGGAIYLDQLAVLKMTHCTASGNTGAYGGAISNHGEVTVKNSIIAGNTATINGATGDVENNGFVPGKGVWTREGANIIQSHANTSGGTDSGPAEIDADPLLAGILENGGFTPTMGFDKDSPARNAAVDSTATTDQRGKPILGVADIGAFEMQAGVFSLTATAFKTMEGNVANVIIGRGTEVNGAVTVRLTTTNGTATSPADFEGRPNTVASNIVFNDGQQTSNPGIVTLPDFLAEGNHTFTATLSIPTATPGASLGTTVIATVTIVDPFLVTNTNDDGPGSLRAAIAAAAGNSGPDTIHFAAGLNGQTITLGSRIEVDDPDDVTVDASNLASGVTIDGGPGTNGIFLVDTGSELTLRRLTLTGGNGENGHGGAVYNAGQFNAVQCTFSGNAAVGNGGAIYNSNSATVLTTLVRCTLSGNATTANGGAIYVGQDSTAVLEICTISGNTAGGEGGGVYKDLNGPMQLSHCTVSTNHAGSIGGGIVNLSQFGFVHCISFGNTCTSSPDTADLYNAASGMVVLVGKNFAEEIEDLGTINSGSGSFDSADPKLLPLAANGGPTRTHALDSDSPARDQSSALLGYTDQRGLSNNGLPDVGSYELQPGGVFTLTQPSYEANEGNPISVTVKRSSGTGAASVRVITTNGTATSPADYTARPNTAASQVDFADGETEKTITPVIATVNTAGTEPNEVFTISLSNPSAGATLGTPSSAAAVIVDPSSSGADGSFASSSFTFPANNSTLNVPVGGTIVVTGTTTDNRGVLNVFVDDGGTNSDFATLAAPKAKSTNWSFVMTPVAGVNTLSASSTDTQLNIVFGLPSHSFRVNRPLAVNVSGNGSVTSGFAPSSYREVGGSNTVTATPAAGFMFAGWTILSPHTAAEIGVAAPSLEKQTLTFIFREGLALRATFVPNPFTSLAGEFNGLIHAHPTLPDRNPAGPGPEDGTVPDIGSEGLLTATVMGTGAFSARMTIDGTVLIAVGAFDHQGVARFGTARATTTTVARTGKPSLIVALTMDLDPGRPKDTISGTVTARNFQQSLIAAESTVLADRAFYDGLTPATTLRDDYLGVAGATRAYTAILPARDNTALGLDLRDYPQGTGYALVTVSKAGVVSITTAKLADGTTFTATCKLSKEDMYPVFVPLYANKGWLSGDVQLDYALSDSDMSSTLKWLRPLDITRHHYPNGWIEVIDVGFMGARYSATFTPAGSVLLQPDDADADDLGQPLSALDPNLGNASLTFTQAQLTEDIVNLVNVSTTNAATKVVTNDPNFTLTITGAIGVFSGKFVHENDAGVVTPLQTDFQGVIYQRCLEAGGHGYFLTHQPVPIDYTGESGLVKLIGH